MYIEVVYRGGIQGWYIGVVYRGLYRGLNRGVNRGGIQRCI